MPEKAKAPNIDFIRLLAEVWARAASSGQAVTLNQAEQLAQSQQIQTAASPKAPEN